MGERDDEVVRLVRGELVQLEMYQRALTEAGIQSKLTGQSLEASFGSALADTIELYVHEKDEAQARKVLEQFEADRHDREGK